MYNIKDYPQIQNHYFLASRGVGPSRSLRGKVGVITCFMKKAPADFSEKTVNQYNQAMTKAFRWLEAEAKDRGVPLQIKGYYFKIDVPSNVNPRDGFHLIKDFLKLRTMDDAQQHFENSMGFDEVPFLIVFDHNQRSFAVRKMSTFPHPVDEISAIFKHADSYQWTTIAHELLHQFGATDLYFPEQVRKCAERYFRDSIMGIGKSEIDDLNAYLIGWKNTVSMETIHFLEETMWLTPQNYQEAIDEAWKG